MVRDLEQIKENDESQLITKKEKGAPSNNGGHHCKTNPIFYCVTKLLTLTFYPHLQAVQSTRICWKISKTTRKCAIVVMANVLVTIVPFSGIR